MYQVVSNFQKLQFSIQQKAKQKNQNNNKKTKKQQQKQQQQQQTNYFLLSEFLCSNWSRVKHRITALYRYTLEAKQMILLLYCHS